MFFPFLAIKIYFVSQPRLRVPPKFVILYTHTHPYLSSPSQN